MARNSKFPIRFMKRNAHTGRLFVCVCVRERIHACTCVCTSEFLSTQQKYFIENIHNDTKGLAGWEITLIGSRQTHCQNWSSYFFLSL